MGRQGLRRDRVLLVRLNDCVGISARLVFQQQLGTPQLLQLPQNELQKLLPELCTFITELLPVGANSDAVEPSELVRRVFSHPEAQWLSRSARQSGISALVCQQLVRLASNNGNNDDNNCWSGAELTLQVLLDALLNPCNERLSKGSEACVWRNTQQKPRFHAMPCFPVWSTLLPFAAQLGLRHPLKFKKVLMEHRSTKQRRRANCDFAHITGLWRLLDEMDAATGDEETVTEVMTAVLKFMVSEKLLLGSVSAKEEKKVAETQLDDQLLDKFITGMQEFAFKCGRASAVLKPALLDALLEALLSPQRAENDSTVPPRVAMFAAVASIYVKGLASDLAPKVIGQLRIMPAREGEDQTSLLSFIVGFCAQVDLVPLTAVLDLLDLLLQRYKTVPQTIDDPTTQQQRKLEMVFHIVYLALHRRQAVDSLRQEVSSESAALLKVLSAFLMRLCSEISYNDFYVAAPVHWTAAVWRHWVLLSDEDVQAFASEARENDAEVDGSKCMATWEALEARIPFRMARAPLFVRMYTLLRPHLIPFNPLIDPDDEFGLLMQRRKRRRAEESKITVDSEQLERSFDVLLLPDVMERVCSFMSAKRLCRMALVCRTFAEVSHRATLWRPLYMKLDLPAVSKRGVVPSSRVTCQHGDKYDHDWRHMYQERWPALRKLRRMQRRAIDAGESAEPEAHDGIDSREATASSTIRYSCPRICVYCGCDRLFKSATDFEVHAAQHKEFTCSDVSCRASFTAVARLKQHMKQHPDPSATPKDKEMPVSARTRLLCGFEGCTKSYLSAKRLATHRQQKGHFCKSDVVNLVSA